MDGLIQDLLSAWRALRKSPGFALVVLTTVALGIGANTAVFSLVNAVLLRPLPFGEPERLVAVQQTIPSRNIDRAPTSPLNFLDWRDGNTVFSGMAAYVPAVYGLLSDGPPEQVWGAEVSAELFEILQVQALKGRTLLPEDGEADAEAVVVISNGLWQRLFGASPDVLGQLIRMDDRQYRIVGVMPPGFSFVDRAEVWTPLIFTPQDLAQRGRFFLETVARLEDGRSLTQARQQMSTLSRAIAEETSGNPRAWGVRIVPLQQAAAGDLQLAFWILTAVVAFVLLVACVNVANLLIARGAERQNEIALRVALGAGRGRIVRHLLCESLMLALLGGVAGLLVAGGLIALIQAAPSDIPRLDETSIDARVLLFTLGISLLTGVIFGLLPALRASRPDLVESLKGSGTGTASSGQHGVRNLLVTCEVALALMVLIGAGLMVRSFRQAQVLDIGFEPGQILTTSLIEPDGKFDEDTERLVFYRRLLDQFELLPQVREVGASTSLPLFERQRGRTSIYPEGLQLEPGESPPFAAVDGVSSNFFRAIGLNLLQGRAFTNAEQEGGPPIAVVDRRLVERFWPGEDPIGKSITVPGRGDVRREVVGVVEQLDPPGLDAAPDPQVYLPLADAVAPRISFLVRTEGSPENLVPDVRSAIWGVDRTQAISSLTPMDALLAEALANRRFVTQLAGLFALLALVLALVGIHGVTSWSVTQRTREIGIRRAFGAPSAQILRLIVGDNLRWSLLGLAVGLGGALALTRWLSSLLFGVRATDGATFIGVSLLFFGVVLATSLLGALKGVQIDPVTALRDE